MVRIGEEEGLRGGEMLHESTSTDVRAEWVLYYFCNKLLRIYSLHPKLLAVLIFSRCIIFTIQIIMSRCITKSS